MVIKIFKGVWFLSLLATLAIFMYVYASLPESILVWEGEVSQSISRDGLFYSTLALLAVFNALIFIISRLYSGKNEYFRAWFFGLVTIFNLFLVVALQFLNLYNSQERFDYESIGFIIYGSISLVVLWSSLWPSYYLFQRITRKDPATNAIQN